MSLLTKRAHSCCARLRCRWLEQFSFRHWPSLSWCRHCARPWRWSYRHRLLCLHRGLRLPFPSQSFPRRLPSNLDLRWLSRLCPSPPSQHRPRLRHGLRRPPSLCACWRRSLFVCSCRSLFVCSCRSLWSLFVCSCRSLFVCSCRSLFVRSCRSPSSYWCSKSSPGEACSSNAAPYLVCYEEHYLQRGEVPAPLGGVPVRPGEAPVRPLAREPERSCFSARVRIEAGRVQTESMRAAG